MDPYICAHKDVRQFDNLRCCMACGETLHLWQISQQPRTTALPSESELSKFSSHLSHTYKDLRLSTDTAIRVIVLFPGEFKDPLYCTIATVDPDKEDYDAISYTWATEDGDDRRTGRIHCSDGVIAITENCEAALRKLRQQSTPRQLWVDSICINQANIDERNHQVGLMEEIYRSASMVHICIQDTARRYTECIAWMDGHCGSQNKTSTQTAQLFRRRYFTRVWIIQEIILAKQVTLHVNANSALLSVTALERISSLFSRPDEQSKVPLVLQYIQDPSKYKMHSVLRCLELSLAASSADPRDRVYGIVSLLKPRIRELIPIDYNTDCAEVFGNAIMACIAEQENLSILQFASLPRKVDSAQACSFGIEELRRYVSTPVLPSSCCNDRKTHIQHFRSQCQVRLWASEWLPEVTLDSKRFFGFPKDRSRSLVQKMTTKLPTHQVLPHLRVRAHWIDMSRGSSTESTISFAKSIRDDPKSIIFDRHPWLEDTFSAWMSGQVTSDSKNSAYYDYRLRHEWGFYGYMLRARCCNKPDPIFMFKSYYSAGFSTIKHVAGDQIFAVDGVSELLILRQVEPSVFRVVGPCYLWASSLEPSDRNRRLPISQLPDHLCDMGSERTRNIEIY